jgi:hypothetical protein
MKFLKSEGFYVLLAFLAATAAMIYVFKGDPALSGFWFAIAAMYRMSALERKLSNKNLTGPAGPMGPQGPQGLPAGWVTPQAANLKK